MDIATTFIPLLQVFSDVMTQPTAESFRQLVAGWLFAPRRTVLGMMRSSNNTSKHHSAYHRVFASAKWSVDRVGLTLFNLVIQLTDQDTYYLVGDDTTLARTGLKVFGAGMHRDACLSSRGFTVVRWGHCWVVLAVIISSRRNPERKFAIPILMRLYLNQKTNDRLGRKHRKKTDLMIEMLEQLHEHASHLKLHFLGDSAYTGPRMLARMPRSIEVTGRLGTDARLHDAPPARTGKRGRPSKRGKRLPNPTEMLAAKGLTRMKLNLYQQSTYHVRVATQQCYLYLAPERVVYVVVVEHLRGGRGVEVFYTTDVEETTAETVVRTYSWRWPIETTFQDSKQHLGLGEAQNRVRKAVDRTVPSGFYLYGLIVLWHEYIRSEPGIMLRAWQGKRYHSFADMLATLRGDCLAETKQRIFSAPGIPPDAHKIIEPLERLLQLAA
jgi:hypothetical protein